MKKSLLTITLLLSGVVSYAQVVFNVKSPTTISGNYDFTYADQAGGWGVPDMLDPLNAVEDTLMFVEDGTAGTNPQGNPISREGCNPLINDLTGKIAVVYRNTCEFGTKAFNAQAAGARAVIIINREDAVIAMGPGADGAAVTIPVVFISSVSGQTITNIMNGGGTVVGFIGSKMGLFDNDLGMEKAKLLIPSANTNPSLLALSASENSKKLGAKIFNYGNSDQMNVSLKADVTFGGNNVFSQTAAGAALLASGDSILVNLPDFQLSSYPVGKYTLTYSIMFDNDDEYPSDNTFSVDFSVSDGVYSFAQINDNDSLVANQAYRTSTATTSFQSCIHFMHPNASRTQLEGVYFAASVNDPSTLVGQDFTVHVLEWSDVFSDVNSDEFNALTQYALAEVATASYNYTSEAEYASVYVPLDAMVPLIDNMRYLVCVETFDANTYLGYTDLEYSYVFDTLNQPISPIITDDGVSIFGFTGSPASSIGMKLAPNLTTPVITANGITSFCEGQSITLYSSSPTGNVWQLDGANIPGATNSSLVVTASGSYTVTNGPNVSDPVTITVSAYPAVPTITASGATTFCEGGSVDLTASSTSNNVWSNGSTTDMITVTESGDYTVTNYSGVCGSTSTVTVVVANPLPDVMISASAFAVCQGSSLDLTATGATSYDWGGGVTSPMITISPLADTTVTLTGTDANNCVNTNTVSIQSLTSIVASIDSDPADGTICSGEQVTLLASNGATYTWEDNSTGNVRVLNPTATATYTVTAVLGNCSDDATITITVNSLPTIDAGPDLSGCVNSTVTLNATGGNTYFWNNGVGTGNGIDITVPATTTTYTVTGTDLNGCSGIDQVVVSATPLPTISFDPDTVIVCDNGAAQTLADPTVTPSGGTGSFSGTGVNGNVFNPDGIVPGPLTVTYTANVGGCTSTGLLTVVVAFCSSIDEESANGILVYPNPADNELTIKADNLNDYSTVVLNDQLGRTVGKWNVTNNLMKIDISKFATGNYTLILDGMNGNSVQHVQIK